MNEKIISEISRMKSLLGHQRGVVISEQQAFNSPLQQQMTQQWQQQQFKDIQANANQQKQRQANINNIWCSIKDGIITDPNSPFNGKTWYDYAYKQSVTPEETSIASKSCPATKPVASKNVVNQPKAVTLPSELKDVKSVKTFQDWLDMNKPGWATGYKGGILNKGAHGGGYGKFGPRTSKAWSLHKNEFLNSSQSQDDDVEDVRDIESPKGKNVSMQPTYSTKMASAPQTASAVGSVVKPADPNTL